MKRIVITLVLALFLASCNEFDRDYSKVDGEFARALSFTIVETEMAPGDTITLRTHFAGKAVNPATIKWGVSWQIVQDLYGEEAVLDSQSLDKWIVSPLAEVMSDDSMQIFEMKILIPDSVVRNSPAIPENWSSTLAQLGLDINPEEWGFPANKQEFLGIIEGLAALPVKDQEKEINQLLATGQGEAVSVYAGQLDGLLQLLSVKFRIYCDYTASDGFIANTTNIVRYHSKLQGIPNIWANKRPIQTGAKLYEVSGKPLKFDPSVDKFDVVFPLVNRTLSLDYNSGKSYFLEVTVDGRDQFITALEALGNQSLTYESFDSYWFSSKTGFESMGFVQLDDKTDRLAGKARLLFKVQFAEKGIVKGKPLTYQLETSDFLSGNGGRPRGKDCQEYTFIINE